MKQKSFCSAEENPSGKETAYGMGDKPAFANRGLMLRTHKELRKLTMNKRNNLGNKQSSQRKSYECSTNTLKFVLHFF